MKLNYIFIALCLFCLSCEDSDQALDSRDYPRIETFAPQVTSDGVQFSGTFNVPGKNKITDHGFIWDHGFPDIATASKYSMGPLETTGPFQALVQYNFEKGKEYNVRAYATTSDYTVMGQNFTFKVE
jgi:hypothetical protein